MDESKRFLEKGKNHLQKSWLIYEAIRAQVVMESSEIVTKDSRIQGVKGSSEIKNEYRISNKKFRIMKFYSFDIYPPIFLAGSIPCSIFCGSLL